MPRMLFEKTGRAVWISHLDLMRVFQRAFHRAGLHLKHTQGFNPRPSVSIALPLSVGITSNCELLDFELDNQNISNDEILKKINEVLIDGVHVLSVYDDGDKIKNLSKMKCGIHLEYDAGLPADVEQKIMDLFSQECVIVEKKNRNGTKEQNIIPMMHHLEVSALDDHTLELCVVVSCQNPALNPMQINEAIGLYLPECAADFVSYSRHEIYDSFDNIFR